MQIYVTQKQLEVFQFALDLFVRINIGQIEAVADQFIGRQDVDKYLQLQKALLNIRSLATNLPRYAHFGIRNAEKVPEEARIAYDLMQVIRHHLSWQRNPEGGYTVNYDRPYQTSTEILAKIMSNNKWLEFIEALKQAKIEHPNLKVTQLAQAIIECGRGTSSLFQHFNNPYGMKYRKELRGLAVPVVYNAHDGTDEYCRFLTIEAAAYGYWIFLDRLPYEGWEEHVETPETFIKFIARAGYVGGNAEAKTIYINKVISVMNEARKLLEVLDA